MVFKLSRSVSPPPLPVLIKSPFPQDPSASPYEDPSQNPPKKHRFRVLDVVVPEFPSTQLWLQRINSEDGSSSVYLSDGHSAVLRHDPFELFVRDDSSGERVLSLNSHGLFKTPGELDRRRRVRIAGRNATFPRRTKEPGHDRLRRVLGTTSCCEKVFVLKI